VSAAGASAPPRGKVDGGYVVNERKFSVSLAGCAPYYVTAAIRLGY
jgi:hypothetical protein